MCDLWPIHTILQMFAKFKSLDFQTMLTIVLTTAEKKATYERILMMNIHLTNRSGVQFFSLFFWSAVDLRTVWSSKQAKRKSHWCSLFMHIKLNMSGTKISQNDNKQPNRFKFIYICSLSRKHHSTYREALFFLFIFISFCFCTRWRITLSFCSRFRFFFLFLSFFYVCFVHKMEGKTAARVQHVCGIFFCCAVSHWRKTGHWFSGTFRIESTHMFLKI